MLILSAWASIPHGPTSAPITLTIQQTFFTAQMTITPCSIQLPVQSTCMSGYVIVVIPLPRPITQQDLRRDTITINGSPLTARKQSLCDVPLEWRQYISNPPADCLVLFYTVQDFVNRLGASPGVKTAVLEMTIGAGHSLTASGQVTFTVQRICYKTYIIISPDTIQLPSPGTCLSGYIMVLVRLPVGVKASALNKDTVTINGSAMTVLNPSLSQLPDSFRQYVLCPPANYLVLFFDRQAFVSRLGASAGVKTGTLEMTVGTWDLLTSPGQVTFTAPRKK